MKEHAVIENDSNSSVFLTPCPGSKLLVNGKSITEKTELHHNNRVMFGSNHLYAFNHPQEVAKMEEDGKCPMKISFESAQEEIAQSKGFDMDKSGKTKDDIILQDTMVQMMTMVNEANAISEELDQKMFYEIVLMSAQAQGLSEGKTEVSIKAKTLTNGNEVIWTKGDFVDRKYAMQEIYQAYMEEDKDWNKKQENGFPFSSTDDNEIMIGTASLYVQSLAYLMDMDDNLPVRSYNGTEVGVLSIEALPFSEQGQQLLDECVEEPEELIGKNFQFRIDIKKILGLPKKLNKVWCRYTFLLEEEWNESEHVAATQNADMTFQKMFKAFPVTKELVDEFENTAVVIQVWGNQTAAPDDPAKANLSTKELMTFEDAVSIFKSEKHGMHNKAAQQSRELRRKESELNHLQVTLNDMKKSQLATEQQSTMLKQENHELERKVVSQKAKLDLMTKIVKEAQTKGEQVALVARIDFILRNAKDLPQQDIDKLLNRIKDPTSSNIKSSTPPEAKPSSKKAPKRPSTPSSRN